MISGRCVCLVRFTLLVLAAIAACGFAILEVDKPLAVFFKRSANSPWVATAQILIVLSIPALFVFMLALVFHYVVTGEKPQPRNRIFALVLSAVLAILCVEVAKAVLDRISIDEYIATGAYGFRFFTLTGTTDLSSFPSEYGAIAGVAAAGLWLIVPVYRPTIVVLGMLLPACQVITAADFLSDIIAGLEIGIIVFLGICKIFQAVGDPIRFTRICSPFR